MVSFWFNLMMLALESTDVVRLRCMKISRGGPASQDEARLMIVEKLQVCGEAGRALAAGSSASDLIDMYRTRVASNQLRLAGSPS